MAAPVTQAVSALNLPARCPVPPRSPEKVQQVARKAEREIEKQAKYLLRESGNGQVRFIKAVHGAIPQLRSYDASLKQFEGHVRAGAAEGYGYVLGYTPPADALHVCGPECAHGQGRTKEITDSEANLLRVQFVQVVGEDAARQIDTAALDWARSLVGTSADVETGGIYMKTMFRSMDEARKWVYSITREAWERQAARSPSFAAANPWEKTEFFPLSPEKSWIRDIFSKGFELVSSKITKFFLPTVHKVVVGGANAGLSWDQIARDLNRQAGTGGLWHWQRLVRTEMAGAVQKTLTNRAAELGAPYIKWSAANNACPICRVHRETNQGYYKIENAPAVPEQTHPNCRCSGIVVYSLPQGVKL